MWTYHAVAAVIRGHVAAGRRAEVDATGSASPGISWGGYLTCIVAGLDDRLKVAVPVYGCGFLHENSAWIAQFDEDGRRAARAVGGELRPVAVPARREDARSCSSTARTTSPTRWTATRSRYRLVKGPRTSA